MLISLRSGISSSFEVWQRYFEGRSHPSVQLPGDGADVSDLVAAETPSAISSEAVACMLDLGEFIRFSLEERSLRKALAEA